VRAKNRAAKERKRSNARHQVKTIEIPDSPFSIFNKGPGNPSLRKDYLLQRREDFVCLLEPAWHEFGWELKCARTVEQVHQAFQLMAAHMNPGRLAPIFRGTCEPATKASIESARAMYVMALEKSRSLADAHQAQFQIYRECQGAGFTLSEDFEKGLKEDLARRKENIRTIQINISNQKGMIRKAQLQQGDESSATKLNLPALKQELKRFEDDRAADEDVCRSLKKRIGSITPEAWRVVSQETERQKRKLDSLEQESRKADLEYHRLETILLDQEAFFFRSQLLDFRRKADYEFTPRNVANALAGLPYITSRRSAELCSAMKSEIALSGNYELLIFISSIWKRYNKGANLTVIDWFKLKIRELPKHKIIKRKKMENFFRTNLAEKWFFLQRVLENFQRSKLPPGFVPYAIIREFLRQSVNPESPADSILAANNKITD
jgi:hypothetical protein